MDKVKKGLEAVYFEIGDRWIDSLELIRCCVTNRFRQICCYTVYDRFQLYLRLSLEDNNNNHTFIIIQ
jgi:hypothetical protein